MLEPAVAEATAADAGVTHIMKAHRLHGQSEIERELAGERARRSVGQSVS